MLTFYPIHRGMMMTILKAYDIPTRLLASIDTIQEHKGSNINA